MWVCRDGGYMLLLATFLCIVETSHCRDSWLEITNVFSNLRRTLSITNSEDESEFEHDLPLFDTLRNTWDAVDDVINIDLPNIPAFGWKDIFDAGAHIGKAAVDLASLQNFVPDLSTYGFDTDYVRNHLNSWNWEKFTDDLMRYRSDGEEPKTHAHSSSSQIDNLSDLIHSYTSFEASVEDKAALPPECFMTVPQMVRYAGYPCAVYNAVTKDGYKLTMHRIPFGSTEAEKKKDGLNSFKDHRRRKSRERNTRRGRAKRPVVFLQHGILSDSSCWVTNGPGRSLAFALADAGFDVWMGNVRGNTYSRAHIKLDPDKNEEYWRFTWQHMSEYDLPAMVDAVLRVTSQRNLYYIGHSQGTLIAFARLAEDLAFNNKIKMMFALGPVATLGHINSPVKWLSRLTDVAHFGVSMFGGAEVLPSTSLSKWITAKLHAMSQDDPLAYHGNNLLLFLVGFNVKHYHKDRLPVFLAQTPSGTSLHNFIHMSQLVDSGRMQKWSHWSASENMKMYGDEIPPEYDVGKIQTPIALFLGSKDDLADVKDGRMLALKLNSLAHFRIMRDWDHLDFMWGKEAPTLLYPDIIGFIEGIESKKTRGSREHIGFRHVRGVDDEL